MSDTIGIVVLHYEDQGGLDRVLTALEACTRPLRVVVADDGSARPPQVGARPYRVGVVTQEDRGFRAAAARNLGARSLLQAEPTLRTVLFLDGDTVPGPGYVEAMDDALHATASDAPGRRALVVGRRRYARLDGLTAVEVAGFVASPTPERILPDTAWLDEGYAQTANLRRADDRSYRFVISSVLGCTPELLTATRGFDESFIGYGGEDWDLANRAWLAGADLRHVPEAVAWHDGPDAAGREAEAIARGADPEQFRLRKLAETARVARVVTEPGARDAALVWDVPDVTVTVDDTGMDDAAVLLLCGDLLRGTDAGIWLREGGVLSRGLWPASDPRVHQGAPPRHVLDRARYRVQVTAPVRLTEPLSALTALCTRTPIRLPGFRIDRTRDLARDATGDGGADRPFDASAPALPSGVDAVRRGSATPSVEAEWGWRDPHDLPPLTSPSPAPPLSPEEPA